MKIKRIIFWSHLVAGVLTGIVVLLLSVTGTLLTYERQMTDWADRSFNVTPEPSQIYLSVDQLAAEATEQIGEGTTLVFKNSDEAPVAVEKGRDGFWLMNPYSGKIIGEGAQGIRDVFHFLTMFHRWFALEDDSRDTAKAIVGASNLIFLFIILSGIYLWLPKIWKWVIIKKNLLFSRNLPNAKARDYNWHHVFGIWALMPLFFIIVTGTVFSYDWAGKAIYASMGIEPPTGRSDPAPQFEIQASADILSLQEVYEVARDFDTDWNRIGVNLAASQKTVIEFEVDTGTGGQPTEKTKVYISRVDGSILKTIGFDDATPARQVRGYIRFLHTGEALGFIGQTFFGIASLAACFLVYTGLALAYRRLLQPLLKKRAY